MVEEVIVKTDEKKEAIFEIAKMAVEHSGGRLRIAFNEADKSMEVVVDAAHFLKLDESRLGRDLELYGFMGSKAMGWEAMLPMFLEEVILPLKRILPESYSRAGNALRCLGESVYEAPMRKSWKELF